MRVLHVTDCYLPRLGGIETHVQDLVTQQRAEGHDARVLTLTPAGGGTADPRWVTRVAYPRVSVTGPADATRQVLDLLAGADVVHAHVSVVSPFTFGVARRACARSVPTLVTVHSLWSHLGALPTLGGAAVGLAGWPVQWSAVSEAAAAPVRRTLGAGVPVLVLPNAVDPSRWQVPHRAPVASPVPTIFSVMRFARTKRPLALVRMLREVRARLPEEAPLRAVLIGDGPQRPPVERYLERHGMRDWVELPGRLSRAAIREAYADAGLYVAPAERESFGIAALEARCAGLPVVASSHGGVGSFVTPGVNGWLADDDAGMVRAMVRLLTDRAGAAVIEAHNRVAPRDLDWPAASARALDGYARAALIAAAVPPARQLTGGAR
jgi:glycosyltransferase involved in cell wall biosynthesis